MQKCTNQGPLKFLKLANDLVLSLNHFLSAKNNPNKHSWDWKPLFSQKDFQNAVFSIFFGKILWRRNKFQLTNYLFDAEISYEIKAVRFGQMKILGRGTEPKKIWNDVFLTVNKRLYQFHMFKSNEKVTRKGWAEAGRRNGIENQS